MRIDLLTIEGSHQRTLIMDDLANPTDVALDPVNGCVIETCFSFQLSYLGPVCTNHKRQCCDDDTVTIENNGVTPRWVTTPFSSDYIVFNEGSIVSINGALTMKHSVNGR